MVFMAREGSHYEIFGVNPDGSGLVALTRPVTTLVENLPSNVSPAWSPDGKWIAVAMSGSIWKVDDWRSAGSESYLRSVPRRWARMMAEAIATHGGMGYAREFHVERLFREVRALRIYEGTSEVQKLVIAGQTMKALA